MMASEGQGAELYNRGEEMDNQAQDIMTTTSSSSASEDSSDEDNSRSSVLDLAYLDHSDNALNDNLETYSVLGSSHKATQVLLINHNRLTTLPPAVNAFRQLTTLDISSNRLTSISTFILSLENLRTLIAKHNNLSDVSAFPKDLERLTQLQNVNLAGNRFKTIPPQLLECSSLKTLHLGGNELTTVPPSIVNLQRLEVLYLGGNQLTNIPVEIGCLSLMRALYLSENKLEILPASIAKLRRLKSLALHNNRLRTLPPEIIKLRCLTELSLRDNPLVVHFVKDMAYDPPSLLEIAARTVNYHNISYTDSDLPRTMVQYLSTAQRCVNPKCKGVYFDTRVENIRFVDFCGKYHLPLLQYLCSTNCDNVPESELLRISSDSSESDEECFVPKSRLKKVLLG